MQLRSGLESTVEHSLHASGVSYQYESTVLKYTQPQQERRYLPDFLLEPGNGKKIFLEVKGILTSADRKKLRLIREQYPSLILIMIFGNASNKLNKKSPTTYSDWCNKYKILWVDVKTFTKEGIPCLLSMIQPNVYGKSVKNQPQQRSKASLKSERSLLSRALQERTRMKGTTNI